MNFQKCAPLLFAAAVLLLSGCSSPPAPIAAAPVPTATSLPPVPLPTPKPVPTMTPRQKRAERRAQRKKERAERRRVANEKTAEKKRLALAQRAQNESESDAPVRSVLEELDWKYQENASQIIAMSDKGSEILAEAGLTESRTSIMEQVNKVMDKPLLDDNGNNNQKYAEYLALYITMRKGS